jgi:hypothetical protein
MHTGTWATVDAGVQTESHPRACSFQIVEALAYGALGAPGADPLALARFAERTVNLHHPEDRRATEIAVLTATLLERELTARLLQLAARGLLVDATGMLSIAAVAMETRLYNSRPHAIVEHNFWEEPGPMAALPEPAIVIDDDQDDVEEVPPPNPPE